MCSAVAISARSLRSGRGLSIPKASATFITSRTSGAIPRSSSSVGRARRSTGNRTTLVVPDRSSTDIATSLHLPEGYYDSGSTSNITLYVELLRPTSAPSLGAAEWTRAGGAMRRGFCRVDESRQSSVIQSASAREPLRAVLCRVAVPAIKSTGGRYNYSVARNSLRGEAAPAGRLGSDIAVQPPAAFRWLPGNVRRLDNAGQIAP